MKVRGVFVLGPRAPSRIALSPQWSQRCGSLRRVRTLTRGWSRRHGAGSVLARADEILLILKLHCADMSLDAWCLSCPSSGLRLVSPGQGGGPLSLPRHCPDRAMRGLAGRAFPDCVSGAMSVSPRAAVKRRLIRIAPIVPLTPHVTPARVPGPGILYRKPSQLSMDIP